MMIGVRGFGLAVFALAVGTSFARAGGTDPVPGLADEVLPLLKARCVKCHGPGERKAGLNLATPRGIARGGKNGAAVVKGQPDESLLWSRVDDDEMPPKEPLAPAEKDLLRRWIASGASGLPDSAADAPEGADHWAFAPLGRPGVPAPRDPSRARNAVDLFLLDRLTRDELTFAPEADRAALARRVTFDLTGLPPTPEELAAFQKDSAPDAYERLVERLLASPRYGERWGKHWLDAAGYADSNGYFNADTDRPLAWRYRDYVVRAVASDTPFDRFVREQIAGDELTDFRPGEAVEPEVIDRLVATHFLRNGQDGTGESDGNPDELRADRYAVIEGAVQNLGSALFGLTFQCARCHDHKFEPVSQRDYYALQAVLRPAFPVDQADRWLKPNARVVEAPSKAEQTRWEAEGVRLAAEADAHERAFRAWAEANREAAVERFRDGFDLPLAGRWRSVATPGVAPVALDAERAPGAAVRAGTLRVIESGSPSGRRLVTANDFDWTPEGEGNWVEATFRLVDLRLDPKGARAERVGFYIAVRETGGATPAAGNLLIDGNPDGGGAVEAGYPGPSARRLGVIGAGAYQAGRRYGVRVTNAGGGMFSLEHLVDGEPEGPSLKLPAADLPDGGFGFEYCCGRSFLVDDVVIASGDPSVDPAVRKARAAERSAKKAALDRAAGALKDHRAARPGRLAWVHDGTPDVAETHVLARGDYASPGPKVAPAGPAVLADPDNPFEATPPAGSKSTGRRLALARWLTHPGSRPAALLARVTVNRVWQQHFGTGLVATSENLGYTGAPPSHPELLEYLASEFVRDGWSLKALHRLIVTSAAYRQSSVAADEARASQVDPDGRLLSRFPLRRLDAEAVRDAMLAVAGTLDTHPFGPYVPSTRKADGEVVVDESTAGARRRSVYLQQRRTQIVSVLEVFDAPSIVTNCPKRPTSTVPLQSLSLLNSDFAAARAGEFSARLAREAGDDVDARLTRAFLLATARPPADAERDAARRFLASQPARYPALSGPDAAARAWADFCQMLLASNGFLYVE